MICTNRTRDNVYVFQSVLCLVLAHSSKVKSDAHLDYLGLYGLLSKFTHNT